MRDEKARDLTQKARIEILVVLGRLIDTCFREGQDPWKAGSMVRAALCGALADASAGAKKVETDSELVDRLAGEFWRAAADIFQHYEVILTGPTQRIQNQMGGLGESQNRVRSQTGLQSG